MNSLTETEHVGVGQRQRVEDHGKVIFASVFFFFFALIHPTCKNALRKKNFEKLDFD